MSDFATLMELARSAGIQVTPPVNLEVPAVTGNGLVGDVLNCTMGTWTGEPTAYAYQWTSDGTPNAGVATDYTVVAGDVGHALACIVTATNGAGSVAAPPSNAIVVAAAAGRAATAPHAPATHEPAPSRENPGAAAGERNRTQTPGHR